MPCKAKQFGDQMICEDCRLVWRADDYPPAECQEHAVDTLLYEVSRYSRNLCGIRLDSRGDLVKVQDVIPQIKQIKADCEYQISRIREQLAEAYINLGLEVDRLIEAEKVIASKTLKCGELEGRCFVLSAVIGGIGILTAALIGALVMSQQS